MLKNYVLDTSILLYDPKSIYSFENNNVIIPLVVLEEIDKIKQLSSEIGKNAREVVRILDKLTEMNNVDNIKLENGGVLRIEINNVECGLFSNDTNDKKILSVAKNLNIRENILTVLVTKDINLRVLARVCGVRAEDYYTDKIKKLYTGIVDMREHSINTHLLYKNKYIEYENDELLPNQYIVSNNALCRYNNKKLWLINEHISAFEISPKNKEQRFALDALLNPEIKIVTLSGTAGTGKTLLAIAAALEQTINHHLFSKILITRPIIPFGNDIGFLPGNKDEKIRSWMQPIFDNLSYIFNDKIDPLIDQFIEMEALTYIRGRSLSTKFIIVDEAQNLTKLMVKTILTRVGENTKIVFTGDPDQIDVPYLDKESNGFSYLIDKIKQFDLSAHVTLCKGERSEVAKIGAEL